MNKENREAIEKRLQEIKERCNGDLLVDDVIRDARKPNSPLHGEFDWDVEKAAMEHWRETARQLIRAVQVIVVVGTESIVVPRYIRDPDKPHGEQGYIEPVEIKDDHSKAMAALMYEVDRAESLMERARMVAVALGLEKDIDNILRRIAKLKEKAVA
jgi:hypothetical protein